MGGWGVGVVLMIGAVAALVKLVGRDLTTLDLTALTKAFIVCG